MNDPLTERQIVLSSRKDYVRHLRTKINKDFAMEWAQKGNQYPHLFWEQELGSLLLAAKDVLDYSPIVRKHWTRVSQLKASVTFVVTFKTTNDAILARLAWEGVHRHHHD